MGRGRAGQEPDWEDARGSSPSWHPHLPYRPHSTPLTESQHQEDEKPNQEVSRAHGVRRPGTLRRVGAGPWEASGPGGSLLAGAEAASLRVVWSLLFPPASQGLPPVPPASQGLPFPPASQGLSESTRCGWRSVSSVSLEKQKTTNLYFDTVQDGQRRGGWAPPSCRADELTQPARLPPRRPLRSHAQRPV